MVFEFSSGAQIVGNDTSVCVLLTDGLALNKSRSMEDEFKKLSKDAEIIVLISVNNKSYKLSSPNRAWKKYGVFGGRDELYACSNLSVEKTDIKTGDLVSSISISSDTEINVMGIFWESTNRWDKIN